MDDKLQQTVARMVLTYLYDSNMADVGEQFWAKNRYLPKTVPPIVLSHMTSIGRLMTVVREFLEVTSIINEFSRTYMDHGFQKSYEIAEKVTFLVDMCKSLLSIIPCESVQYVTPSADAPSNADPANPENLEDNSVIVMMDEGVVDFNDAPVQPELFTIEVPYDAHAPLQEYVINQDELKENIRPSTFEPVCLTEAIEAPEESITNATVESVSNVPYIDQNVASPSVPTKAVDIKEYVPNQINNQQVATRTRLVPSRIIQKRPSIDRKLKRTKPLKRPLREQPSSSKVSSKNATTSITPQNIVESTDTYGGYESSSSSTASSINSESDEGIRQMTSTLQRQRLYRKAYKKRSKKHPFSEKANTKSSLPHCQVFRPPPLPPVEKPDATTTDGSELPQQADVGEDTISAVLAHIYGE
ncbi:uncharacterized protein LOC128270571 [Anopheles cruzii]|uniref:uncharacterized protein LOC128270571 n=1 Tax=Anopheles cruzii TaxID=68878 RepID=UPI0022EC871A|nr:uncharacterized protein LOC128270571 [Anopheles cruzii]